MSIEAIVLIFFGALILLALFGGEDKSQYVSTDENNCDHDFQPVGENSYKGVYLTVYQCTKCGAINHA